MKLNQLQKDDLEFLRQCDNCLVLWVEKEGVTLSVFEFEQALLPNLTKVVKKPCHNCSAQQLLQEETNLFIKENNLA